MFKIEFIFVEATHDITLTLQFIQPQGSLQVGELISSGSLCLNFGRHKIQEMYVQL
jgi:hypothetical protein